LEVRDKKKKPRKEKTADKGSGGNCAGNANNASHQTSTQQPNMTDRVKNKRSDVGGGGGEKLKGVFREFENQ